MYVIQMIPKIIFQTSLLKQPNYVTDLIQHRCQGWKYYHFTDDEIVKFIIDNPIEEFKNSVDILKTIHTGAHRADFFRYYFLYVNGGIFLDSDAMIEQDIDLIFKLY
jgi:mannosyltransferase OCH1-like enzyme